MMERHLIYKLLENYNKLERPVNNESAPLNVTFSITLQQIIDVVSLLYSKKKKINSLFLLMKDEKNQILVSNIWLNIVSKYKSGKSMTWFELYILFMNRNGSMLIFSGIQHYMAI